MVGVTNEGEEKGERVAEGRSKHSARNTNRMLWLLCETGKNRADRT